MPASGDDAPVGIDRIVGGREQSLSKADLVELEREASVLAGELVVLAVENRGLLQNRKRALLLAHGFQVARVAQGRIEVARVLCVFLAPPLGGLL